MAVVIGSHRDNEQEQLKKGIRSPSKPEENLLGRRCDVFQVPRYGPPRSGNRRLQQRPKHGDPPPNPKHQNPNLNPLPSNLDRRPISIKRTLPLILSASYHRTFCCITPKQNKKKFEDTVQASGNPQIPDPHFLSNCLEPRLSDNYV